MYYIYCYIDQRNNWKYVGQVIEYRERARQNEHGKRKSSPFDKAYSKCPYAFQYYLIDNAMTQDEADAKEKWWIAYFNCRMPNGYNIQEGGNGNSGYKQKPERKTGKNSGYKNHKHTSEWRAQHSEDMKGVNNPMYGKPCSEERKIKISEANKGRKDSEETRKRKSESHVGKNYGRIGANHKASKPVICIETGIIYAGIREAGRQTGIDPSTIGKVCRGRSKTAGGYHWKYI